MGNRSSKDGEAGGDSVYAACIRFIAYWTRKGSRYVARELSTLGPRLAWWRSRRRKQVSNGGEGAATTSGTKTGSRKGDGCAMLGETIGLTPVTNNNNNNQLDEESQSIRLNGSLHRGDLATAEELQDLADKADSGDPGSRPVKRRTKRRRDDDVVVVKVKRENCWGRFRLRVKRFVQCDHFTRGILVAILVNTLSMGVEYHQQPEILTTVLECSNYL